VIAFACSHCAQRFQVKEEFAGRSTRCPTCKQALVVPPPDRTQGQMPDGPIDGTPSSVARAGVDGGVTLAEAGAAPRVGPASVPDLLARHSARGERYLLAGEIARGGMGAVLRAVDCDIRREVAVKYLLDPSDPRNNLRFVEEAQITGQLEHPNIVPIHELGVDGQRRLFFSMKMVKGRSLAQVLDRLRKEPAAAEKEFPLGRLLTVVIGVCHALAYAHSRRVVHRDLKPANIMVGDFGEVYVMDWGLAKVLRDGGPAAGAAVAAGPARVATSREAEADLTEEGAVLGTPVYMPPEQAAGDPHAVDARSDVYALGAVLYEILTLRPPVDREGGHLAVLMRVVQGEILPPHERSPERARAGKIPRELAAVAMKALAKDPAGRYPGVEALRRDIELYQEGRSVSAKADTFGELTWKLVKRNRAATLAAAVVALALLATLVVAGRAWWATGRAYAALRAEQRDKQDRTLKAIPAFIESARLTANRGSLDDALKQLDVALLYDPDNADARLLRGELLIARKDLAGARAELETCLRQQPANADARQLAKLCGEGKADDIHFVIAVAGVLQRGQMPGLATKLLAEVRLDPAARKQFLDLCRTKLVGWDGAARALKMDQANQLSLSLRDRQDVVDLTPLEGIPLSRLNLWKCPVTDLRPLRDMPLTDLDLAETQVDNLDHLRDMPLTRLSISHCGVQGLDRLQGKRLQFLDMSRTKVENLTPLGDMPLVTLKAHDCKSLSDLKPLRGRPLTHLYLHATAVSNLEPLAESPLEVLDLSYCGQLADLDTLKGRPRETLTTLDLVGCNRLTKLTPLRGMQLETLGISPGQIKEGMDVIRGMTTLKTIITDGNRRWSADEFWKDHPPGAKK
jgi:serine/threonine protein kinase